MREVTTLPALAVLSVSHLLCHPFVSERSLWVSRVSAAQFREALVVLAADEPSVWSPVMTSQMLCALLWFPFGFYTISTNRWSS